MHTRHQAAPGLMWLMWPGHGVWPVPSSSFFLLETPTRAGEILPRVASLSFSLILPLLFFSHRPMHRHRLLHRFLPLFLLATISTSARLDIDIYRRMPPVEYLFEPDGTPPEDLLSHPPYHPSLVTYLPCLLRAPFLGASI